MGRGIAYSFALHAGIILILLAFASLGTKPKINFDEVVKVSLASLPAKPEPTPIAQPTPAEATPKIPVEPPKPTAKKVVTEQQKPKPKKEKPKQQTKEQQKPNPEVVTEATIDSVTSGENSAFKGATVDNPNFNYGWWFSQAFYKISSNWRNTVQYDGKLVCTISFQVIKSGRVFDLKVTESSGIPEFDNSCVSAVELSSPFPPLPRDFPDEVIGITIPMSNI